MKKIFSAFLLMTMMVFSVGSFVACSDLENEIAAVDQQATENAEAIADLNSKLTSLQTALTAAQADADAAMAAAQAAQKAGDEAKAQAEAAKAAAATAKAEAVAEATAVVEKAIADLQEKHDVDIKAVNEKVAGVEAALELKADKETVTLLENTLKEYKATLDKLGLLTQELETAVNYNLEAITNLQGTIQTQQMDIDDLKVAVEGLVAAVKAINDNLVSVYNLVAALANQIQSIVYVPENLAGTAVAQGYIFGSGKTKVYTDLLVKMTYEVSPKGLASAITADNAAFSTVPVTKAAPAEYFKVQVVDADPATGRVVVYAHIPAKTAAYAALTDVTKDDAGNVTGVNSDTNVALALNVADAKMISLLMGDEPEILDAGTYVQSAYTAVTPADAPYKSVYDLVTWYNKTKKNTTVVAKDLTYEVPWNLAASSTRELFSNYEIRLDVNGAYMTVAEASEFFGQDVKVAYDVTHVDKINATTAITATPASENNPFTVTGKDLTATAQFANVKNVKDGALVGYNTAVTVGVYVNGATAATGTPAKTLTATYTIVDKQADIVLADIEKAWAYTEKDDAVVPDQEVDVLEAAGISDFAAFLQGATWKKNPTATWKYMDGTTEKTATATAVVEAKSKKAVTVKFNNGATATEKKMTYAQAETATYAFTGIVNKDKVDYKVTFNVKLGAMPADKTIDLNNGQPFQLNASLETPMVMKDLTPVTQSIAHIQAVDENFTALKDIVTHSSGELSVHVFTPVSVSVKEGDKDATAVVDLFLGKEGEGDKTKEKTTLTLSGLAKYDNTLNVVFTYDVYGVTFKYTATIVTTKPTISFKPSTAYVTGDNKVELDGTVKLPITAGVTGTSTQYTLNAIDLRNYVNVTIPKDLADDFYIRYTLKTTLYDEEEEEYLVNYVDADGNDVLYTNEDRPSFVDPIMGGPLYEDGGFGPEYETVLRLDPTAACPINWWTDLTSAVYEIALVSKTQIPATATVPAHDNVFASFDVTLVIPELLTFTAPDVVKVKIENGVDTEANIVGALSIVDKFGNDVYNKYVSNDLNNIWKGYVATYNTKNEIVKIELTDDDFFRVYDGTYPPYRNHQMNLDVDESAIKAYIGTTDVTSEIDFDFITKDEADANPLLKYGTIILSKESATIQGDVEFQVPVVLTYLYDDFGKKALTAVAKVVFSKNDVTSGNDPDAAYPTPVGAQWKAPFDFYGETIEYLDFGQQMKDKALFPLKESDGKYYNYIFDPFGALGYKVSAINSTSGVIEVKGDFANFTISYSDFDGENCTFDLSNLSPSATNVAATKVKSEDIVEIIIR